MAPFLLAIPAVQTYLILPVKNGSEKVTFHLLHTGQMVREFDIELAHADPPDWWAAYDISAYQGQDLTLALVDGEITAQQAAWLAGAIYSSADLRDADDLYHERFRPQFHFTPRRGWNNDPNGMLYANGEWHLYYQYNPFGIRWGNMHWGHAVSRDLFHWQELPVALFQRSLRDMAFSGGGLVDWRNTSGFGSPQQPPLVVAFTSTGRGECLAYSLDGGRTLVEFPENPILSHWGRDPKIIWYPPEEKWVMIVYEELELPPQAEKMGYAIYDSPDLHVWTRRSFLPDFWECPELFSLPLDGSPQDIRWVIYGSRIHRSQSTCLIGSFDGATFTPEAENEIAHYGPQFYASQIFSDAPDGRRIMIGWLRDAVYPGMPFSQGMTVPLELSLRATPSGPRLCFYPVREITALRQQTTSAAGLNPEQANQLFAQANAELLDVELRLSAQDPLVLDLRGYLLHIDPIAGEITFAGATGRFTPAQGTVTLRLLLDRALSEIFVNDGEAAFSALTIAELNTPLALQGSAILEELKIHQLKSIWE